MTRSLLSLSKGAVPARHTHALPVRSRRREDGGEGRPAPALGPRAPHGSRAARRSRFVEGGVQAQPGHADHAVAHQRRQQLQRGKAAVGDQHRLAMRHPAAGLPDHLARPVCQFLVPPSASAAYRSEGASTVRNGKAHTRPAQGIGANNIRLIQRSPPRAKPAG